MMCSCRCGWNCDRWKGRKGCLAFLCEKWSEAGREDWDSSGIGRIAKFTVGPKDSRIE